MNMVALEGKTNTGHNVDSQGNSMGRAPADVIGKIPKNAGATP